MDWCSVGTKYPNDGPKNGKDRAEHDKRDYDPIHGLESGDYGETVPISFKVVCVCDCCDKEKMHYALKCTVQSYLKMKLSPKNIKANRKRLAGAYGHEQLHVQNLLATAENVAKVAEAFEKTQGCATLGSCVSKASVAQAATNTLMNVALSIERKHKHPSGHPAKGSTKYQPIGIVPMKSDCKSPGTPKLIKPGEKCC